MDESVDSQIESAETQAQTQKKKRISWKDEALNKTFLEACIHEVTINGRQGTSLQPQSWIKVGEILKNKHSFDVSSRKMRNRYHYIKFRYSAWCLLKSKTRNHYDPTTNKFNFTDAEWTQYSQNAPLLYPNLCKNLYDGAAATSVSGWGTSSKKSRTIDLSDDLETLETREEEKYRKARVEVKRKSADLGGYSVEGLFVGGHETCVIVPELKSTFDIGSDSTSDPGNNNFIGTSFRSNFPPYGKDFTNHTATGQFTNGLLANDFIARYVGVKDYVPPYLNPSLDIKELVTGVSFASAGFGFDPLTPTISNVISLSQQLEYFKQYKGKLEAKIGKERTNHVITNALFIICAGTNDFIVNYYTVPICLYGFIVETSASVHGGNLILPRIKIAKSKKPLLGPRTCSRANAPIEIEKEPTRAATTTEKQPKKAGTNREATSSYRPPVPIILRAWCWHLHLKNL
ncbi:hypothetical protein POM88_001192 [Heracleum sosnowskyi]|uniref:Myb/SANT-like domain-containing protein n=1 Tax=Heracleum sosnowskyi TaxID=360622 RepID=A0AAD8JC19_9APIA|nr:hypothetical protein POM88_001192 [Heracleum sosnowskyi]